MFEDFFDVGVLFGTCEVGNDVVVVLVAVTKRANVGGSFECVDEHFEVC